jgi:hypothetical protein
MDMTSTRGTRARTDIEQQDQRDEAYIVPTPEEEAEIEEALAEAELGGGISAEELLNEMRELRAEFERKKR